MDLDMNLCCSSFRWVLSILALPALAAAPAHEGAWITREAHGIRLSARRAGVNVYEFIAELSDTPSDQPKDALKGPSIPLRRTGDSWQATFRALPHYGRASVPGLEISWPVEADEGLYGLGERFDSLNQHGKRVALWIEDQPGQHEGGATYFVTPSLLSTRGYAFSADDNPEGEFDLDSDGAGRAIYRRAGNRAHVYIITGNSPSELIRRRAAIQGLPRNIPDWAWGPWISRNSFENQGEAEEALREMKKRGLPVAAIVQEAWKGPSETGSFNTFDSHRWAGAQTFLDACREDGIRNILWQVPILHPSSPHFAIAAEKGYFVKNPEGGISYREHWLNGFANIDFTNPEAVRFWQDLIRPVVRMGIAGFKADDGEAIKPDDVFFDGRRGWQMHNEYSLLYGRALQQLLDEEQADGLLWARSGTLGCNRIPALWAGDQFATWTQYRSLLPAGLSCAMSGVAFWGHDIGGYIDRPSEELYIRWVQFGALSPLMQYHGIQRREPWEFGPQAEEAYRRAVLFRMNLTPELIRLGRIAAETGLPIMRPMLLEFPDDPRFRNEDSQYLLGENILVFPLFEEGTRSRSVAIPEGRWVSLDGQRTYTGPADVEVPVPLLDLPLLLREGASLPGALTPAPKAVTPSEEGT